MADVPPVWDERLRDAAGDLLAALRLAVEHIETTPAGWRFGEDARELVLARARAVISQATGEAE